MSDASLQMSVAIPSAWLMAELEAWIDPKAPICYGILMPGDHFHGGVPVVKVKDIIDGRIREDGLLLTNPAIDRAYRRSRLLPGDVLITIRGTTGRVALVPETLRNANITQDTARLRVSKGRSADFVYTVLQSKYVQDQVESDTIGQAVKGINIRDVKRLILPAPPLAEQRAIARAATDAGSVVESLERLIGKTRRIKLGAMQELLTGKRRLPGFEGEWEVKTLGDLTSLRMGHTPSRTVPQFWGPGHVWLSIGDLWGKHVCSSAEQITTAGALGKQAVRQGTLLMSFKLSIGRLSFAGCDLYTNEAICALEAPRADAEYLYYALQRVDFALYGKQAVKGYTLNTESLQAVEVPCPEPGEQRAIAAVLSDMDAEIAALEARLSKARRFKRGMMQQLLTGRIRLV